MQKDLPPTTTTLLLLHTDINQALSAYATTHFPRQRVMLADWNEVRINSRWYHWEKMEHNVENAPYVAATGHHNQEREPIVGTQLQGRCEMYAPLPLSQTMDSNNRCQPGLNVRMKK